MALVISFVLELKELPEGFMVTPFVSYYCGSTHAKGIIDGERSTSMGKDGMIETVFSLPPYRLAFCQLVRRG